jgi:hypothetical protein
MIEHQFDGKKIGNAVLALASCHQILERTRQLVNLDQVEGEKDSP